ncbi:MAG: (2Fe-2S) ferredoxin domain-containing protein [Spirochaetaceae bacterium]|nr:(2Fe-2S) ferredoxin domain-containing protein [Spirochaetaceae bacterium]
MNAQTERIRAALGAREPLATARGRILGQIEVCEGCCCGRTDKGFKPVPRDWIKQRWKDEKLNKSVQLTISGCLGPCDLANVICVISSDGMQWLGDLQEQWHYDLLLKWAKASRDAGVLIELPAALNRHRFERFAAGYGSGRRVAGARQAPLQCGCDGGERFGERRAGGARRSTRSAG